MFRRNSGYITQKGQSKIFKMNLLIAGCGVGSAPAEAAVRLGIKNFTLVDGDIVEIHNLNRQSFEFTDIGQSKVASLKKRLLNINPDAQVQDVHTYLNVQNLENLVSQSDLIIDTIDFLDLPAIIALHDSANQHQKPIISLFSAGFGAIAVFIPPSTKKHSWFRDLFEIPEDDLSGTSYTQHFSQFFNRVKQHLNPKVVSTMDDVFSKMKDLEPCPAPHVVVGAQMVSCLANYLLVQFAEGQNFPKAPQFIAIDLERASQIMNFEIEEKTSPFVRSV
jgi:molybdopterin/thiamine biosynthesis adenylyltransferase